MGRPRKKRQQSTIDLLPDGVRRQLQELLADRRVTQLEAVRRINAILGEMQASGELPEDAPERVSKSAVNRYALDMEEAGAKLRESREVAEVWIGKMGAAPQGQVGQLINEILRTLSFDVTMIMNRGGIDTENAPAVVEMLKGLALTTMRLEKAANLNVEREKEIRKQALEDAADSAEKIAKKGGLSAATVQEIRKEILGIS